jgi:hypothetical protein
LSSHLRLQVVFPSGLPPKPHTHPSCHPYVPYALLKKYIYHIKTLYVWRGGKTTKFVMKYDLKRTKNLERLCAQLGGRTQIIRLGIANGHLVTGSVVKMARMGLSLISQDIWFNSLRRMLNSFYRECLRHHSNWIKGYKNAVLLKWVQLNSPTNNVWLLNVDMCQYMSTVTRYITDQSRTFITDFTEYNIRPGKCASSSFVYLYLQLFQYSNVHVLNTRSVLKFQVREMDLCGKPEKSHSKLPD